MSKTVKKVAAKKAPAKKAAPAKKSGGCGKGKKGGCK